MKPLSRTIRAISCEFLMRKLRNSALLFGGIALGLSIVALWLTSMNVWWWALAAPLLVVDVSLLVFFVVASVAVRLFRPLQSAPQHHAVSKYVDKLERVADGMSVTPLVLLFRVARDVVYPREHGFIRSLTQDSTSMKSDFTKLLRQFETERSSHTA